MNNLLYIIRFSFAIIIFLATILGLTGIFYPLPFLDLQFAPLIQRIVTYASITAIVLFIFITVSTFIFGRLYCSLICPLGIFQEILSLIFRRENEQQQNLPFKYFISAIFFGLIIGGTFLVSKYTEPYTIFSSAITISITGLISIAVIILIVILKNRFFCTNICPVGTVLGLISKFSLLKIYIDKNECMSCSMCEMNCPTGCINCFDQEVNNEMCVKCFKCLGHCGKGAIKYGLKPNLKADKK